jgi:hypothetical protein
MIVAGVDGDGWRALAAGGDPAGGEERQVPASGGYGARAVIVSIASER